MLIEVTHIKAKEILRPQCLRTAALETERTTEVTTLALSLGSQESGSYPLPQGTAVYAAQGAVLLFGEKVIDPISLVFFD